MKHIYRSLIFTLILALCFGVFAVAAQEIAADAVTVVEQKEATLTDVLGREVTFNAPAASAVIAGKKTGTIVELPFMFESGRTSVITGRGGQDKGKFMSLLDIQTPELEDGSVETVAAMKPDVIFLKSYTREDAGIAFEETGIPVIYLSLESPADYVVDVAAVGKVFGEEERAAEILAYYAEIEERVAKIAAGVETKKKVLLLQFAEADGAYALKIAPANWFQTSMVEDAGGDPVWKADAEKTNKWMDVNFEQIAAYDPDVLLIVNYFDDPKANVAMLKEDEAWKELRAVKDGEIYPFGKDTLSWDSAGPRRGLGLLWTVKTLYPELSADIDLEAEMQKFYSWFGLEPDVIEAELISAYLAE